MDAAPPSAGRSHRPQIGPVRGAPAYDAVDPALADAAAATAAPGRPLSAFERSQFEPRFGRDFSAVRLHDDPRAHAAAEAVDAHAYTLGQHIAFAQGAYAPQTPAGRRLLAHELTHTVQQAKASAPTLQRQPKGEATKEATKAPPPKTLQGSGVDLADPVSSGTAQIIDEVLLRNQRLAPYIGDKLQKGYRIADKGRFVQELTDANFDTAYQKAYGLSSADTVPKSTRGFYDYQASVIHVRNDAVFGTALHESVHSLAATQLYRFLQNTASGVSKKLVRVLTEGVTAFFTDCILRDEGMTNFNDAYRNDKQDAQTLITALGKDGFDLMARFNFRFAIVEMGNALGLSTREYGQLKGGGPAEVAKRMAALL